MLSQGWRDFSRGWNVESTFLWLQHFVKTQNIDLKVETTFIWSLDWLRLWNVGTTFMWSPNCLRLWGVGTTFMWSPDWLRLWGVGSTSLSFERFPRWRSGRRCWRESSGTRGRRFRLRKDQSISEIKIKQF
jgi:hypothetical protein